MEELQTKVMSDLRELADEYNLNFSHTDNCQLVFFTKVESGFMDAAFTLAIAWDVKKANIFHLNKTIDLYQVEDYCRLLCEVIA